MFSCNSTAYFQNTFSLEHLCTAASAIAILLDLLEENAKAEKAVTDLIAAELNNIMKGLILCL